VDHGGNFQRQALPVNDHVLINGQKENRMTGHIVQPRRELPRRVQEALRLGRTIWSKLSLARYWPI
jgi:hypothetical protein